MDKKTTIIIVISVSVIGLFAYLIFSGGKSSNEGDGDMPSFKSSDGKKSAKRSKKTDTQNSQSLNSPTSQSNNIEDAQNQSFQSQKSPLQQGYFSSSSILEQSQIVSARRNNSQSYSSSPPVLTQFDFQPTTPSSGGNFNSGSGSSGASYSSQNPRMQTCTTALKPILDSKSTDVTAITSALLNVVGFSMLPVEAQNVHIRSVISQTKGPSAEGYCKLIIQSTNPQSINAASLYTNCQSMVKNFYNTKGSNATEYDAIIAFESMGILNGATTSAQKKSTLQKYLGADYNIVITAMNGLNSTNLAMQSNIICAKASSGIINGVNSSSAYLTCLSTINSAKSNNVSDVKIALPVYEKLIASDQTTLDKYYKEFIVGTKTAEAVCTFIIKNATLATDANKALSGMVLNSSESVNQSCDTLVNSVKSTYNDYLLNSDIDYISEITQSIGSYEFLVPNVYQAGAVKTFITNKITNSSFNGLSSDNKNLITKRLYATYYSLSSFTNPSIDGVYNEIFPQLCKCAHADFDDMAWKNSIVAYMLFKQSGGTSIPMDPAAKASTIASSAFRKTCYGNITKQLQTLNIPNAITSPSGLIAKHIQAINSQFQSLTEIDNTVEPLKCYISQCLTRPCPNSCVQAVEKVCDGLAEQYLEGNAKKDYTTFFTCPLSETAKTYDNNTCYNLADNQREAMSENFYTSIKSFKTVGDDVRKTIIQNVWKIHVSKQKEMNTSVTSSQCIEEANKAWLAQLQESKN